MADVRQDPGGVCQSRALNSRELPGTSRNFRELPSEVKRKEVKRKEGNRFLNITLVINALAVLAVAVATRLVGSFEMSSLALAFSAGVAVTIASRYQATILPYESGDGPGV